MDRILQLSEEIAALWAKGGGSEKLTDAERGRLIAIRERLDGLWNRRRAEKASAKASALDSSVQTGRSPSRARGAYRRGRAERRAATLFR